MAKDRDQTPIPFTIDDRVRIQQTADSLSSLCSKIDDIKDFLKEHAEQHKEELKSNQDDHKDFVRKSCMYKLLKVGLLVIGTIGTVVGAYAAVISYF